MSSNPAEIADRVVESFRERLATDSSDAIDEHHFQALHARAEMVERRPLEL